MQDLSNKRPVNSVKYHIKVNIDIFFDNFYEVENKFLDDNDIIKSSYIWDKTSLALPYKVIQVGLDFIGNDFGDDCILGIIEANRSKIFEVCNIISFLNEA